MLAACSWPLERPSPHPPARPQYLKAEVADQKYKEGAFLLQQSALTRVHSGCQPASASLAPPQLLAQLARLRA